MTKRHDIAIQHSSKRSDWRTPPDLYDALHREFGFQLDVAADDDSALCEEYLTKEEDGLTSDWSGVVGACFMNPPYSRGDSKATPPIPAEPIEPWIQKAWAESQKGATVVGVLPFSPQTEWYRRYVMGHIVGAHMPRKGWTCFHCGETFTTEATAREHFSTHPTAHLESWEEPDPSSIDPRHPLAAHRWMGHAAMEVRQLPYRVTFIDPDTKEPALNAPGNTCIVIWKPNPGYVGPWQPTLRYWSYC